MSCAAERTKKVELLSPAGSLDSARAAVNAGADAIYMGGPLFSARAYAESSAEDMLMRALDYCVLRGVKVYMPLNILIKQPEFGLIEPYLRPYADNGLSGVIVQDLGVMKAVREMFPYLRLHISTQAAVSGARYASLLSSFGAKRVVLARELSLEEIREIHESTDIEIEAFAHGAMCYCYSGLCMMSSFIGGRSGNRGRCAGTCRLPYEVYDSHFRRLNTTDEKYVLSMKDLNTVRRLRQMIDAGVYSFKIEGRMKSPEYTAAATALYRKYLDLACEGEMGETAHADKTFFDDEAALRDAFFRGGFTSAYLDKNCGRDMIVLKEKQAFRVRDEALIRDIREKYVDNDKKIPVRMELNLKKGKLPELYIGLDEDNYDGLRGTIYKADGICNISKKGQEDNNGRDSTTSQTRVYVRVYGNNPIAKAENRPAAEEELAKRLGKLGDTDFYMSSAKIDMEPDCFITVRDINELRRKGVSELKDRIRSIAQAHEPAPARVM